MSRSPFTRPFDQMPPALPLFPLTGSSILPGCQLPLNLFEPRYVSMALDTLARDRLIGIVQPFAGASGHESPPLYRTGVAGRIVSFTEAPENRLMIVLNGVCRFDIQEERLTKKGYRLAQVDWSRYETDFRYMDEIPHDRKRLFSLTRDYFRMKGLDTHWDALEQMPSVLLVNFLCSQLPFSVAERQALIETLTPEERLSQLLGFMEFELAASMLGNFRQH
jgi:Lon protease-like protein